MVHSACCIGGGEDSVVVLQVLENRKIFDPPGNRTLDYRARSLVTIVITLSWLPQLWPNISALSVSSEFTWRLHICTKEMSMLTNVDLATVACESSRMWCCINGWVVPNILRMKLHSRRLKSLVTQLVEPHITQWVNEMNFFLVHWSVWTTQFILILSSYQNCRFSLVMKWQSSIKVKYWHT